jgi:hypothetical protein
MLLIKILSLITGFFRPLITTIKTIPDNMANVEQDGALIPNGALIPAIQALATFGSPAFGNWSQTLVPASLAANTIGAGQLVGGIIRRFSPGAAFTDSTDTATNIVNAIPGAKVNQSFPVLIANLGSGLMTLAAGTGVTIAGTAAIGSATIRLFLGTVTGSSAVTLTSCFGWNLGTGGTLATGL